MTSSTGPDPITVAYNSLGNITSKSGVGSYTYHATKKHAVTAAGSSSFAYDANGNVSTRNGSPITWYSYNLPNTISASGSNSSQFFYAPDRARWKQVASYGGTTETTIYIGGLIEKVTLGAVTSWKHTIAGGSGPVAVYTRKSGAADEMHYLTRDHVGSVDSVTNTSGSVEVRLSHSAFGQRRKEAGWSGNPTSGDWTEITDTTRRGFTFHEMLDNLSLVHMNGRVYDPAVGRFLSADPFVQAPGFTQSFNRYSYVWNNPRSFIDPSGFWSCCDDDRPEPQVLWGTTGGHNARPGAPPREDRQDIRESRPGYEQPAPTPTSPAPPPEPSPHDPKIQGPVVQVPTDILPGNRNSGSTVGGAMQPMTSESIRAHIRELEESLAQSQEMFARHAAEREALEDSATLSAAAARMLDDISTSVDYASMVTLAGAVRATLRRAAANSVGSASRLAKQLGSQEGVAELLAGGGKAIAGAGTKIPIRDVGRLVSQYGGRAEDWAKVTSTASGHLQTHAYRNIVTGEVVELKSILP